MAKAIADQGKCQGCGYCIQACPKGAITQLDELNRKGARYITIDEAKCIGCGACYVVCPDYVYEIVG